MLYSRLQVSSASTRICVVRKGVSGIGSRFWLPHHPTLVNVDVESHSRTTYTHPLVMRSRIHRRVCAVVTFVVSRLVDEAVINADLRGNLFADSVGKVTHSRCLKYIRRVKPNEAAHLKYIATCYRLTVFIGHANYSTSPNRNFL